VGSERTPAPAVRKREKKAAEEGKRRWELVSGGETGEKRHNSY